MIPDENLTKAVISLQVETSCKIVEKVWLNPHAVRLTLEVGNMIRSSFRGPGQFVHIKCGDSRLLRRPISVCTCSEDQPDDLLSVVFEVRGAGTAWLAERREGDCLDVLGLLGNGFSLSSEGRYLLVGGGIGVPPMYGCAFCGGQCDAVLGFRDAAHALLVEDFEEVCATVAVATENGALGEKGFVTGPAEALLMKSHYDGVLCCGPKPMLKAMAALSSRFDVPCHVSLEERMACGVGACLGCAVAMADGSMKHVCKDGPIFNASEVDWNG